MSDNEQLKSYLGAVEKVRQARAGTIDAASRAQIARELGMSDEDLAAARAEGEADLERGERLVTAGLWDDAVKNLDEADALLPDDKRVLHALARALQGRGRAGDRPRAREACRRCLELDPRHAPSYALLRTLERPRRALLAGVAALIVAGGTTAAVTLGVRAGHSPRCPDGQSYCDLAAEVQPGAGLDEITLTPGVLHVSPRDVRLDLGGKLVHAAATEIELLKLTVTLVDVDGATLGTLAVDAQPAFAPPLRPGDAKTFYLSEVVPARTRGAIVSVAEQRATPAPPSYGAGQPLSLEHEPAAPAHIRLSAAWRSREQRFYQGKSTVEGVIEITNEGQGVLRALDCALRVFDEAGKPLGDGSKESVVYPHMPPMAPGERRTVRGFVYLPGTVRSEKMVCTHVE